MDTTLVALRPNSWKVGGGAVLIVGLILAAHLNGYESKHVEFTAGNLFHGGGGAEANHALFAFEGGTITIHYEVTDLKRGGLQIYVFQNWGRPLGDAVAKKFIDQPGEGRLKVKVPETGFYSVVCGGRSSRNANGYDLRYSAWWRSW